MKHTILPLFIAAALMTACGGKNKPSEEAKPQDSLQEPLMESVSMVKEFRTFTVSDCLCFVVNEPDPFEPEYATTGVKDEFSIAWPETGMMTDRAMKELMSHYFGPDASIDIKRAVNNWRQKTIAEYNNLPDISKDNYEVDPNDSDKYINKYDDNDVITADEYRERRCQLRFRTRREHQISNW